MISQGSERRDLARVSKWVWAIAVVLGVVWSSVGHPGLARSSGLALAQTSAASSATVVPRPSAGTAAAGQPALDREFLTRNCTACHNQRLKTAGLALDDADLSQVGADGQRWEKVVRKLRSGSMPPVGRPRP